MRWLAAFALAGCAADLGEPRFPLENCRRVELIDAVTGHRVVGAEDIAYSGPSSDNRAVLWISAYDRSTDEPGGIYRVELSEIAGPSVTARSMLGGVRPHGLASHGYDGVSFISQRTDKSVAIESVFDTPGGMLRSADAEVPCGANDLLLGWEVVTYTVDRDVCEGAVFERLFRRHAGRVERLIGAKLSDRRVVATGMALPNGIAEHGDDVWVAEMRAKRLVNLAGASIDLPGAPDNLNASSEGIVAALQPSLWRFGLYRYGYTGRAATRIVLVDPQSEEVELLYEDPRGQLLSGATAAVLTDAGELIASSVRGENLLVCDPA